MKGKNKRRRKVVTRGKSKRREMKAMMMPKKDGRALAKKPHYRGYVPEAI